MKKIIALMALCLTMSVAKAQIYTSQWPYGAATSFTLTNNGTTTLTVNNRMTYCASVVTTTANATLNIVIGQGVTAGAILNLVYTSTGTETLAFTGAILCPTHTGVAGKTFSQTFVYNGTNFYPTGTMLQLN